MTMRKKATFSRRCSIKALNKPEGEGWDIFNFPNQIKTASANIKDEDLAGFDLKQAKKDHPDHLYVKVFAIKKDEPNDNGDSFSEEELKIATDTFVGVPLFTNHQNDDVEKARGECVHSWYDTKEGGIYIIGRVDKIAYPRLARGIEEGYISGTSMGCSVESSICSVCHNKAHTAEDYCSHVANRKNRKYTGDIKCAYHNSPVEKDDECPLCGSTKDEIQTIKHADQQIFEHNYGLKFIENSFVVNPACHDCGVTSILHIPTLEKKVASLLNNMNMLMKQSLVDKEMLKVAGVNELNSLKDSMNQMEKVVKSMLKQKENVSMEYVSDIVKAMSDLQVIFDELVEMGYGALPSPPVTGDDESPPIVAEQLPEPVPPQNLPPQATGEKAPSSQTTDMGGLGNITMPKNSSIKKEDSSQINQKLINKVGSLEQSLFNLTQNINYQLEMGVKMAKENKTTKTAAGADNLEVITEKQLMKEEETLHPRTGEVYEGITESKEQIAGSEKSNDTTSESPQVRKGTYETTTEDQLKSESALGDAVIHFAEYPDVITEKQWNDFSRDVAGDLPDDYTEQITQAQIRDLLGKHKFIGNVETITEDQLKDLSMTDGLKRWANKEYSLSLVKTATAIVADLISKYRKSPAEIQKMSSAINDDSDMKSKVSFLAVVNSLPQRKDDRDAIASNAAYFAKTASHNNISTVDAIILAAADNAEFGMKAEDVFDTIHHIVNDKISMDKVSSLVEERLNKGSKDNTITKADALNNAIKTLDKPADGRYQIKATMEDIGVPITAGQEFIDGVRKFAQEMIDDSSVAVAIIKIKATEDGSLVIDVQDGGENEVTPDDIGDVIEEDVGEEIDADINGEGIEGTGIEEDTDCNFATTETTKVADAKTEIKKTAQMMGGEMGGQGGAGQGPGAGASLPAPMPQESPPLENLSEDEFGDEGMGMDDTLEPLPPGSICPVCGSDDVDIISGKGQCNNCGSEMTYKIEINVSKWQGVTPDPEEGHEDFHGEEDFAGEGFEMPTEGDLGGAGMPSEEMGEMPSAASTSNWKVNKFATVIRLQPDAVKKVAAEKITVGSISPATGTTNTIKLEDGSHMCLDTGTKYSVAYMVSKDGKQVYGQWEWEPKVANALCPSCSRAKQKFVKALSTVNITQDSFDKMELKDRVETIIKLKQSGALKTIKTASKEGSVINDYKLAYGGYGKRFPIESCIEKLARRFGDNALCLSGPDEGKPLAQSICNRLKNADVYTDKIAIKVADSWCDSDGDEDCITHQVRSGYSLRQAADVCSALKVAVADGEDFLADEMAGEDQFDETPMEDPDMGIEEEVDPFADDTGEGTVTLELPLDIVEQLGQAIDVAEGGGEGIDEGIPGEEVLPGEEGIPGEEDIPGEELGGDPMIDESIGPDELNDCKPTMDPNGMEPGGAPDMMGGEEMKPAVDPSQNLQDQPIGQSMGQPSGQTKPCTEFGDGTGSNQQPCGDIGNKNKGVSQQPQKQVILNGQPIGTQAEVMDKSIGKVGKTQMDLSGVIDILNKQATKGKEISQEKAQDSGDIGQYSAGEGGSQMGHEGDTDRTPEKPSVPRDKALMGQEDQDLNPQDKPQPVIPSGDATMGHEKEVGLDAGDNRYTGGIDGKGKTELASLDKDLYHMKGFGSSKEGISSLADRIAKKLAPPAPVADDKDIQPISDGGTLGKEEKFTANEVQDSEVKSDGGMMGHESETIGDKPDSPKDHPEVFTGPAKQGKEELDSEKTDKNKGTVIANSGSESEAYRVAGRMLQTKKIEASELQSKVDEFKTYKLEQIKDIEKAIFAGEKGLDTVSDGKLSQSVQINETSNVRQGSEELSNKLASLFTLGKQNKIADDDTLTQVRKAYK